MNPGDPLTTEREQGTQSALTAAVKAPYYTVAVGSNKNYIDYYTARLYYTATV